MLFTIGDVGGGSKLVLRMKPQDWQRWLKRALLPPLNFEIKWLYEVRTKGKI